MLVEADPGLALPGAGIPATVAIGAANPDLPAIEIVAGNAISVLYDDAGSRGEAEVRFANAGLDRVGSTIHHVYDPRLTRIDGVVHAVVSILPRGVSISTRHIRHIPTGSILGCQQKRGI